MENYNIEIKETLIKEITIEASTIDEAIAHVENLYKNEDIVLEYCDHNTTDIDLKTLSSNFNNEDFSNFVLTKAEKNLKYLSVQELARIGFGSISEAIKDYTQGGNLNNG